MTWHYGATHRTITTPHGPEDVYEVREVLDGFGGSWTENPIAAVSETKEGLIEVLQMMLRDVREHNVLEVGE